MELSKYRDDVLAVPFMTALPSDIRERVADVFMQIGKPAKAEVGNLIYSQGAQDEDTGCLLVRGRVEIVKEGFEPIHCQAPTLLGEMRHFTASTQRVATVKVIRDAVLLMFHWQDFIETTSKLLSDDEQIALKGAIVDVMNMRLMDWEM